MLWRSEPEAVDEVDAKLEYHHGYHAQRGAEPDHGSIQTMLWWTGRP